MFKLTCIPNWHSIDVSTSRLSIFDISTDFYRARWVDTDPQKIYISTGNDTDHPDSIEYYENSHKFGNMSLYISNKNVIENTDRMNTIRSVIENYIKPQDK